MFIKSNASHLLTYYSVILISIGQGCVAREKNIDGFFLKESLVKVTTKNPFVRINIGMLYFSPLHRCTTASFHLGQKESGCTVSLLRPKILVPYTSAPNAILPITGCHTKYVTISEAVAGARATGPCPAKRPEGGQHVFCPLPNATQALLKSPPFQTSL